MYKKIYASRGNKYNVSFSEFSYRSRTPKKAYILFYLSLKLTLYLLPDEAYFPVHYACMFYPYPGI